MDFCNSFQSILLRRLEEEDVQLVRMSLAHLAGAMTQFAGDAWTTQLLTFADMAVRSDNWGMRAAGFVAFRAVGFRFPFAPSAQFLKEYRNIYERGLLDDNDKVRLEALLCIREIAPALENPTQEQLVLSLVPQMAVAMQKALAKGEEHVLTSGVTSLHDLFETTSLPKSPQFPDVLRFMLHIYADSNLSYTLRDSALQLLESAAKRVPKSLTKTGVSVEVLNTAIRVAIEPCDFEHDPSDPSDLHPVTLGCRCVDSMATQLPAKYVYRPLVEGLRDYLSSPDPNHRRAALLLFGVAAEGCSTSMRKEIGGFMQFTLTSLGDPHSQVVAAAASAIPQFMEFLQPEVRAYSRDMVERIVQCFQQENESIKEAACGALEAVCDHLKESDLDHVGPSLVQLLMSILSTTNSFRTQENCVGALGALAAASKAKFTPHVAEVFSILEKIISQTDEETIMLRARAITTAAELLSVDSSEIRSRLTELVFQSLGSTESTDIRYAVHRFIAYLVYATKQDFSPYLQTVMPPIIASCLNSDALTSTAEDNEEWEDDDSEGEGDDGDVMINPGVLDEQEAALCALQAIFENVPGSQLTNYLPVVLEIVEALHKFFHEGVRKPVSRVMQAMMMNAHHTWAPEWLPSPPPPTTLNEGRGSLMRGWLPGLPARTPVHLHTKQLWVEKLWPLFREMLEDEEKEVISEVCSSLGGIFEMIGPDLLTIPGEGSHYFVAFATKILRGQHPCQKHDAEGAVIDMDEDTRAAEEELFDGLISLISGVAQALGPQFLPSLQALDPLLQDLLKHPTSTVYRSIGIGSYAEICLALGTDALPVVTGVAPIVLPFLSPGSELEIRRNAAFCAGVFFQVAPHSPIIQKHLPDTLGALLSIVQEDTEELDDEGWGCHDNALAALGRALQYLPRELVPLETVVPSFLRHLPLRNDNEECPTVLQTLVSVYYGPAKEFVEQNIFLFLRGAALELAKPENLSPEKLKQEVASLVRGVAQTIGRQHPAMEQLVVELKHSEKARGFIGL